MIAFDGERSCDPADPRDRFDASPRQARAIAWATLQSCRFSCAHSAARLRIRPNAGARDGRRTDRVGSNPALKSPEVLGAEA
jgi:hypothetical protein